MQVAGRRVARARVVALVAGAVQTTGLAPAHMPVWQVSVCVQALPSLQAVPLGAFGFEHVPFAGLHVPATWH